MLFLLAAAKNLILAGVKSVTLHDEGTVELWDLSSNFIFSENDVGKNRALAAVQKLQELNNAVVVRTLTTKLTKEQLSDFQVLSFLWIFCWSINCLFIWFMEVVNLVFLRACLDVHLKLNLRFKSFILDVIQYAHFRAEMPYLRTRGLSWCPCLLRGVFGIWPFWRYSWEENIFPYYFSMHGDFFKSTNLIRYHLDGRGG